MSLTLVLVKKYGPLNQNHQNNKLKILYFKYKE